MRIERIMQVCLLSLPLLGAGPLIAAPYASATGRVDAAVSARRWQAVHDRTTTLRWAYPDGAASATVAITNLSGCEVLRQTFTPPAVTCVWTVCSNEVVTADDYFTVTVSFDVGDALVVGVALLKSSFGGGATVVPEGDRRWGRVGDTALIPYDAAWLDAETAAFSLARRDGQKSTLEPDCTVGWYGWHAKAWGTGWFDLSLSATGTEDVLSAAVRRVPPGGIVLIE